MTVPKGKFINKAFSLLRGTLLGRLRIYRTGPDKDLVVSLSIEASFQDPEPVKPAAAAAGA